MGGPYGLLVLLRADEVCLELDAVPLPWLLLDDESPVLDGAGRVDRR